MNNVNRVVLNSTFTLDGLNELNDFQKNRENYVKLLELVVSRLDNLQIEFFKGVYFRFLDNAYGEILDDIASKLFIERGGKSDEGLRASIKLFCVRQNSEPTRPEVVNILNVLTNNGYFVINRGEKGYISVTLSVDCFTPKDLADEMRKIFPIDSNLRVSTTPVGRKAFGVKSRFNSTPTEDLKIGALSSRFSPLSQKNNSAAVTIISDERGV